jgi:pSer/pThr/pTyr-binding forkhead associated (FHA) protein
MQTRFRLKGVRTDRVYSLDKTAMLIGRSPQCDISIDSGLLSRHHASLVVVNSETVVLRDLDSTNGTFINTMKIVRPTKLNHGDIITIGDEKFIFISLEIEDELEEYELLASEHLRRVSDDGSAYKTMIESSFFRVVSALRPEMLEVGVTEEENKKMFEEALSKKNFDRKSTPGVFLVKSGTRKGMIVELKLPHGGDKEWSLGRSQLCDVVLDDPTVSNVHAIIRWEKEGWIIRDNGSTNGVVLNGQKVSQTLFNNGDALGVGNIKLIFKAL